MSHEKIRLIFDSIVVNWAKTNNIQVAFQNVKFTHSEGETYLQIYLLPASTRSNDLAGDLYSYIGVYQINIVVQAGKGIATARKIIDELIKLFPIYQVFELNNFKVQVITPMQEANSIQNSTSFTIPVSFQYRSDIFI